MLSRIVFIIITFSISLFGVEGAISVAVESEKQHFISQEIVIKVDLKTTAFSVTNVKIHLENSDAFIILAPSSASFTQTENIDDEDWQVVRYEYKLYPLRSGTLIINPFRISFEASMGYGQPKQKFNFLSEVLSFEVNAPQGVATNSFVLSTPSYSVESAIAPKNTKALKIGDAITLQITQNAHNVPDILLQPSHLLKNEHFKVYEEEPKLSTQTQSLNTLVKRVDSYTLVAIKEGNVTIAPQVFRWLDSATQTLHEESTPAYSFVILPIPKVEVPQEEESKILFFTTLFSLGLFFIILLYKSYPVWRESKIQRKKAYIVSEKGCFQALLYSKNNAQYYENLYIWLETLHLNRGGFKALIELQPSLQESLDTLEEVLVHQNKKFNKKLFQSEVKKLRENILYQQSKKNLSLSINPK